MSEAARWARSFGSVADDYERNRPPYAEAAIDWIASRLPLREVLDLAAGTGKLTRQLVARGARVVAVEPDPEMRATFARVVRGVEIVDGRAEEIPLPDAAVDVVAVGQAFHWFDMPRALAEMWRVTRPGGGYALVWNRWSDDDPILAALDRALADTRAPRNPWDDAYLAGRFAGPEERTFAEPARMTLEQLEGWAASTSAFVTASRAQQEEYRARIREIVGAPEVEVLLSTLVVVADRV